jgi:hypothetical protein
MIDRDSLIDEPRNVGRFAFGSHARSGEKASRIGEHPIKEFVIVVRVVMEE